MMASTGFITKHPVLTYFALTFAISWAGFVLVVGPGGFPGTGSQFDALLPLVASAMLAGPAVAGILLTVLLSGTAGLRELLSRLLRWRVGARWYVAALLPAPVLSAAVLFALSLTSPIFTAESKAAILLTGITAGLTTVLEEVGWTGFAVPRLRRRHSVVATGLIVGVVWAAWHLLQSLWVGGTYAGSLAVPVFVALYFFTGMAQLMAYRVLMVWVYDRTESLLVATLMHGSLTASTIFVFTPAATGASFLIYTSALAGAMWIVVAAVALASSGQLSRRPLQRRMACGAPRGRGEEDEMMATTDRNFFDGYLDAWNAHDPAAVARYMADDAIYEDVALGRVLHGPSEIAAFVEEATRASSDFRFEEVSLFTAGGDYANEWIMIGTNDRAVKGVPATGRSFRVRGASVGKLDASGRIVENRDYYNLAEMLAQLGIQPAAPPKPA